MGECLAQVSVDEDTIKRKLLSIEINKGAGPDGIPPRFISKCAFSLVVPIHIIFNESLKTDIFPDVWKVAKVVPVHEGDDDSHVSY